MEVVRLDNVRKEYRMGAVSVYALRGITVLLEKGDFAAIMGPSGSGKSTLLNILGCLDRPTSGEYVLAGKEVSSLTDDQRADIRSREIGFVFQSYNLIPQLSVLENIEVPLFYQRLPLSESRRRGEEMAAVVGLSDRVDHRPSELSGGEQQRVAIARAIASDPAIILADEPTGNLDSATGEEILRILGDLNREGKTLIIVTHDESTAARAGRRIYLRDGLVTSD